MPRVHHVVTSHINNAFKPFAPLVPLTACNRSTTRQYVTHKEVYKRGESSPVLQALHQNFPQCCIHSSGAIEKYDASVMSLITDLAASTTLLLLLLLHRRVSDGRITAARAN
jgi:hypothetical protein